MTSPSPITSSAPLAVDPAELDRVAAALSRAAGALHAVLPATVQAWLRGASGLAGTSTGAALAACARPAAAALAECAEAIDGYARALRSAAASYRSAEAAAVPGQRPS